MGCWIYEGEGGLSRQGFMDRIERPYCLTEFEVGWRRTVQELCLGRLSCPVDYSFRFTGVEALNALPELCHDAFVRNLRSPDEGAVALLGLRPGLVCSSVIPDESFSVFSWV